MNTSHSSPCGWWVERRRCGDKAGERARLLVRMGAGRLPLAAQAARLLAGAQPRGLAGGGRRPRATAAVTAAAPSAMRRHRAAAFPPACPSSPCLPLTSAGLEEARLSSSASCTAQPHSLERAPWGLAILMNVEGVASTPSARRSAKALSGWQPGEPASHLEEQTCRGGTAQRAARRGEAPGRSGDERGAHALRAAAALRATVVHRRAATAAAAAAAQQQHLGGRAAGHTLMWKVVVRLSAVVVYSTL